MTTRPDWHSEDIKAAIRKTGLSLQQLAVRHGYSASAVRVALSRPWPAVQSIIAAHLQCLPEHLWPSRYGTDGQPLRRPIGRPRKHRDGRNPVTHRKTGGNA